MQKFESPIDKKNEAIPLLFTRKELDAVLDDPEHTPEEVLALLEKNFGKILDQDIGVKEGYSLREHTLMVLWQYHKYFKNTSADHKKLFEFVLALHDIGKPKAVADKKKNLQHAYTKELLIPTLTQLGYTREETSLAESLIDGDPIGLYLRGGDIDQSAAMILAMAKKSGISLTQFWELLTIYYQVDAGSYTEDAGGFYSLDELFIFDPTTHTMTFAPPIAEEIRSLQDQVMTLASNELK